MLVAGMVLGITGAVYAQIAPGGGAGGKVLALALVVLVVVAFRAKLVPLAALLKARLAAKCLA